MTIYLVSYCRLFLAGNLKIILVRGRGITYYPLTTICNVYQCLHCKILEIPIYCTGVLDSWTSLMQEVKAPEVRKAIIHQSSSRKRAVRIQTLGQTGFTVHLSPFFVEHILRKYWISLLVIKPTRCINFSNLFFKQNSTCFGQVFCPSSGVQYCIHSNTYTG